MYFSVTRHVYQDSLGTRTASPEHFFVDERNHTRDINPKMPMNAQDAQDGCPKEIRSRNLNQPFLFR
jgi:hypothetical protein